MSRWPLPMKPAIRAPLVPGQRSAAVDFFRGLALIAIALDHVSLGWLQQFTLHAYAWCDAAEVFVFLGGFSSAAAFASVARKKGANAAKQRFFFRAWEIYRAFLFAASLMLALGSVFWVLGWDRNAMQSDVLALLQHPWTTVAELLSARRQPYLSAILPVYALLALGTPLFLFLRQRIPLLLFLLSVCIWLVGPRLELHLPTVNDYGWSFNPFAWQLLFALGLFAQAAPARWQALPVGSWPRRIGWALLGVCVLLSVVFAGDRLFVDSTPSPGFMKQNLAWIRLLNFVALAGAAFALLQWPAVSPWMKRRTWISRVGRHSLSCFVFGSVVSLTLNTVLGLHGEHPALLWRLLCDATAIALLLGWGALYDVRWPTLRWPKTLSRLCWPWREASNGTTCALASHSTHAPSVLHARGTIPDPNVPL